MERILLVDDDVELCEILAEYFAAEGFDFNSAHDGVRGLERARSGEHAILILDLLLPGMRGLDVLRQPRVRFERSRADPGRAWRGCGPDSGTGAWRRRLSAQTV